MDTVRTTIRIRKDLLDQSRILAIRRSTSLQNIINESLAKGLGEVSDLNRHKRAMEIIDRLRESLKGKKVNVQALVDENKRELEERTNRILRIRE